MQLRCAVTRRTSPEIAIKAMFTSRQFSSWLPIYSCRSLVTMALRFGHKSSGSSSFRAVSPVLGFHGFQGIQTVTLSRRHKFRLFFVLEFVLPIRTFLMTIASHERIKLELSAQAVWQFPTSSSKEVQLIVHVSRSLSDQFSVWVVPWSSSVSNTSPQCFIRMLAPNWRIIVIGDSGGMNCYLPSADMGSSSTRNRITLFTPTIPVGKSRTCTTLAVLIPPQVAIMLDGVTSTGPNRAA